MLFQEYCTDSATRVARLERAIGLVAKLPAEIARSLLPEEHAAIVAWVLELRRASGSRAGGPPGLRSFLPKLVDVHLAAASEAAPEDAELAYARAVFAADRWLIDRQGATAPILELFAKIIDGENALQGAARVEALRDRARFQEAAGLLEGARRDFETLITLPGGRDPSDLRSTARLIVDPKANPGGDARKSSVVAFVLLTELIDRAGWMRENPAERLQDLEMLTERALATGDIGHRASVDALLDGLPPLPETGTAPDPPGNQAKWHGLLAKRSWHQSLLQLRARILPNSSPDKPQTDSGG